MFLRLKASKMSFPFVPRNKRLFHQGDKTKLTRFTLPEKSTFAYGLWEIKIKDETLGETTLSLCVHVVKNGIMSIMFFSFTCLEIPLFQLISIMEKGMLLTFLRNLKLSSAAHWSSLCLLLH